MNMTLEIHEKLQKHEADIGEIKLVTKQVVTALDNNTSVVTENNKLMIRYMTKHDGLEEKITRLERTQIEQGKELVEKGKRDAANQPVIDAVRGIVWKIVSSVLLGGGGIAAIIIGVNGSVSS